LANGKAFTDHNDGAGEVSILLPSVIGRFLKLKNFFRFVALFVWRRPPLPQSKVHALLDRGALAQVSVTDLDPLRRGDTAPSVQVQVYFANAESSVDHTMSNTVLGELSILVR
jgi:hypothetical protein